MSSTSPGAGAERFPSWSRFLTESGGTVGLNRVCRVVALLVVSCVALYCSPYEASDLAVVPDSVEYAAGAMHLADGEGYVITVDGKRHPPRYPPWFSGILAPAYLARTRDRAGNGIFVVLAFGVAGILAAYATAHRVSGVPGGLVAATLVLLIPDYLIMSRHIMSDLPASALVMVGCLLFVRAKERPQRLSGVLLAAGAVLAIATGLRILMVFTTLPFFLLVARSGGSRRRRAFLAALVAAPVLLVELLTGIYNLSAFGSMVRSGYNYWCPVPYDFTALTWSPGYLLLNVKTVLATPVTPMAGLAAVLLLARRRRPESRPRGQPALGALLEFAALGVVPSVLLHLTYFYQDTRFFLPAACVLAILCGSLLGLPLAKAPHGMLWTPLLVLAVSLVMARAWEPSPPPVRRAAAEVISAHTPRDAVIISSLDPAFLELMVGEGSGRTIMVLSRDTEYASKFVAPRRIAGLRVPPAGWRDQRHAELVPAGAREAVERVAGENPEEIAGLLKEGRRVFVVNVAPTRVDTAAVAALAARFDLVERRPGLLELAQRKSRDAAGGGALTAKPVWRAP